jgi:bacillithiol system protein YtxJ
MIHEKQKFGGNMMWNTIESEEQFKHALDESYKVNVVLYKHSPTCGISAAALERLESGFSEQLGNQIDLYYIDVLQSRTLSRHIADVMGVRHQSPQMLLIKDGKVIFHNSHYDVGWERITPYLSHKSRTA